MEIKLAYLSKKGHVQTLAQAISQKLEIPALQLADLKIQEPVDLLFLGGALYAGEMDQQLRACLQNLDNQLVKRVAIFGCAAREKNFYAAAEKILAEKHIPLVQEFFWCRGGFLIANRNRPNAQDAQEAAAFARRVVAGLKTEAKEGQND